MAFTSHSNMLQFIFKDIHLSQRFIQSLTILICIENAKNDLESFYITRKEGLGVGI